MNNPTLSIKYAERLAAQDAQELREDALHARASATHIGLAPFAEDDATVIADGSMYSPSWRTLSGGNEAYTMAGLTDDEGLVSDFLGAYEEALDELLDELGMYWEEGCIWLPLASGHRS